MKQKSSSKFFRGLIFSSLALVVFSTAHILLNQPSYAGKAAFFCGKSKFQGRTVPATFARTQNGKQILMLRWVSDDSFPPPWTAQRRCDEVSRRFQRGYDNGSLKYLTTGIVNRESVVCTLANQGDACTSNNLLFTLKPGTKPSNVLARLLDRRGLAAGRVLNESGGDELTIDIDAYIQGIASQE